MLGRNLESAKRELDQLSRLLALSNRDRTFVPPHGLEDIWPQIDGIDHTYWRGFEHCSIIIRAYATFERFVIASVEQWIEWCLKHHPDVILKNENARGAYERGLAEILRRKTEARFAELDRGKLAIALSIFYSGVQPVGFSFPTEPFFSTLPNLRLSTVIELFNNIGLESFSSWVIASKRLREFCIDEGYRLDEELAQLVERRNEAAHGNGMPEEILGPNELTSRVALLSLICEAIFEFILTTICKVQLGSEYERGKIGTVTRIWPRHTAFELEMAATVLYTGTKILMSEEGCIASSTVKSLQLEGAQGQGFCVEPGTALGVVMPFLPTVGMHMIQPALVPDIDELILGGI